MKSASCTTVHATRDPSPTERKLVNDASRFSPLSRFRAVTPLRRDSSPDRRRFFEQPESTCFQVLHASPLPDRRTIPRAAELSVKISTPISMFHLLKELAQLQCACETLKALRRTSTLRCRELSPAVFKCSFSKSALQKKRCTVSVERRPSSLDAQSASVKATIFVGGFCFGNCQAHSCVWDGMPL